LNILYFFECSFCSGNTIFHFQCIFSFIWHHSWKIIETIQSIQLFNLFCPVLRIILLDHLILHLYINFHSISYQSQL
jgi:hypothetical protein